MDWYWLLFAVILVLGKCRTLKKKTWAIDNSGEGRWCQSDKLKSWLVVDDECSVLGRSGTQFVTCLRFWGGGSGWERRWYKDGTLVSGQNKYFNLRNDLLKAVFPVWGQLSDRRNGQTKHLTSCASTRKRERKKCLCVWWVFLMSAQLLHTLASRAPFF